jgi:hypothetical protein
MFRYLFTVVTENIVSFLVAAILWTDRSKHINEFSIDSKNTFSEMVTNIVGSSLSLLSITVTIIYFLLISVISVDTIKENMLT